jgi:hypothetical protein
MTGPRHVYPTRVHVQVRELLERSRGLFGAEEGRGWAAASRVTEYGVPATKARTSAGSGDPLLTAGRWRCGRSRWWGAGGEGDIVAQDQLRLASAA